MVGAALDVELDVQGLDHRRLGLAVFSASGWYGMKKGLRGRLGMYMPPLLEALGFAEVEHNPKNNRMRAI